MSSSSKRPRASSLESDTDSDLNVETSSTVGVPHPDLSPSGSAPSENNVNTCCGSSSVFTDDILPVILDNLQILTPTDLLNFRLVNRCWRDAATSVLLKRMACDITLVIGLVTQERDVTIHSHEYYDIYYDPPMAPIAKYCNARSPHHSILPDLIQLISTSSKFPSNSLKFSLGCEHALNFLSSSPANENYHLENDELMQFFSFYGKKIKKLSFFSGISPRAVQNLLFVHLPNLICLDLRYFEYFKIPQYEEQNQHQIFYFPASPSQDSNSDLHQPLKIEVIYIGTMSNPHTSKELFVEKIISLSPSICAIHYISLATLSILIKMRKAHLVKCLEYNPPPSIPHFMDRLEDVCGIEESIPTLKLSELTVNFTKISGFDSENGRVTRILNMILRGSKETLEYLEFYVNPEGFQNNIQIPQLKNLKCLKLVERSSSLRDEVLSRHASMEWAMIGPAQKMLSDRQTQSYYIFQFENPQNSNRIPLNYFPALSKVMLDLEVCSELSTYNNILAFFVLEHPEIDNETIINGDVIPSVTSLEITTFPRSCKGLGKLFPNASNLKIKCTSPGSECHNWVWEAFPKLKIFEILDFVPCWHSQAIFSFFTGIYHEVCAKFVNDFDTAASKNFSLEHMQFLRTQPYIGDCVNLEEFTIKCRQKFSDMFLIILKRLYGFHGLSHKGKIIFYFESVKLSEDEIKEINEQLKPISSFVEIRQ